MTHISNVHLTGARWTNCEHRAEFEKTTSEKIKAIVLSRGFQAIFGNFLFSRGSDEEVRFRIELSKRHITVITSGRRQTQALADLGPELQTHTRNVITTAQKIHRRCVHSHQRDERHSSFESQSEGSAIDTDTDNTNPRRKMNRRRRRRPAPSTSSSAPERSTNRLIAHAGPSTSDTDTSIAPSDTDRVTSPLYIPPLLTLPRWPLANPDVDTQTEEMIHQQPEIIREIENLKEEINKLQKQLEESNALNDNIQRAATDNAKAYEATLQGLKDNLSKLQGTLQASEQQVMALTEERAQHAVHNMQLERNLNAVQQELIKQVSAIDVLQQANQALNSSADAAQAELQHLRGSNVTLRTQTAQAVEISERATAALVTGQEKRSALEQELISTKAALLEAQMHLNRFSGLGEGSIAQLNKINAELTQTNASLEAKTKAMNNALALAQRQAVSADEILQHLRAKKEETDRLNQKQYEQLEALQQREQQISSKLENATKEIERLKNENTAITEDSANAVKELRGQIHTLEIQVTTLKKQLQGARTLYEIANSQLKTVKKTEEDLLREKTDHAKERAIWNLTDQNLLKAQQEVARLTEALQEHTPTPIQAEEIEHLRQQLQAASKTNKTLSEEIERLKCEAPMLGTPTGSALSVPSTEADTQPAALSPLNLSRTASTTDTTEDSQLGTLAELAKAAKANSGNQAGANTGGQPDPYLLNEALSQLSVKYLGNTCRRVTGDTTNRTSFNQTLNVCFYSGDKPIYEYGSLTRPKMGSEKVTKTGQWTEEGKRFMLMHPALADKNGPQAQRRSGALARALDDISAGAGTTVDTSITLTAASCLDRGQLPQNYAEFTTFIKQNPMKLILKIEAAAQQNPRDPKLQNLNVRAQKIKKALQGVAPST